MTEKYAMKMYQLIEWFQVKFPVLHQDLVQCNHNFSDEELNPYHLESDCWSHTMMVCKVAELSSYSKTVQIAALLHDIGKPASRKVNLETNRVRFFGHEALSAKMSEEVLQCMMNEDIINSIEKEEIYQLILHHAFLHKNPDPNTLIQDFNNQWVFCRNLVELSRCDSLGRFSADIFDDKKHKLFLGLIEDMENIELVS